MSRGVGGTEGGVQVVALVLGVLRHGVSRGTHTQSQTAGDTGDGRGAGAEARVDRRLVLARPDGLGTALCILPERRARDGHNVWDTR